MISSEKLRQPIAALGRALVPYLGSKIVDCQTGELLGRAFLFTWRAQFYVCAYNGDKPLRLVWLSEDKVRYWRSRIGFTTYSEGGVFDEE